MTGINWRAFAITAGLAAVATVASAQSGIPDPSNSSFDPVGVGDNTGNARGGAPVGFDVAVRDVNDDPVIGVTVTLDFSATDVRAYSAQNAGITVNATLHTLTRIATSGFTNFAAKTARFDDVGMVKVSAGGGSANVQLGSVKWRSTDIDGLGGNTGLSDVAYYEAHSGQPCPECNFDLSASDIPGLGDFAILAAEYLSGAAGSYAW